MGKGYMRKRVYGVYGKVVYRERVYGDGVYGNGVYGNGVYGNGVYGNGVYGNGVYGNGVYGEGVVKCYDREKGSCWVSNVYYSVRINYTWTMTTRSSSGCGQTHMMSL